MRPNHIRLFDLSAWFWVALLLLGTFLYAGPPEKAAERRQAFTRGVDHALGNMGAPDLVMHYGGLDEDPELNERVRSIFQKLVSFAMADRPDLEYEIFILMSDIPNAFALPGGKTYITRGLLDILDSDEEIAGVLGHELVHTVKSHGSVALGRDIGMILAYDFVLNRVERQSRQEAAELANISYALISTGHSRAAETEADRIGLRYAAEAGFDPMGLVRALEKIEEHQRHHMPREAQRVPVYFRTHPLTEDRVRALREEARNMGYDVYVPGDPVTEALRRLHEESDEVRGL